MVQIKPVTKDNLDEVLSLRINEDQAGYVSSTAESLAQAYVYQETAFPFAVYSDGEIVGFIMMGYYEAKQYYTLWKLLIDRDMTRADLRKKTGISPATVAKMSKGETIGANVLERICAAMQCDVGDVMTYVPDSANASKGKKVVSR